MIYLILAYEFFKIGLFSIGGGMATLPFLMDLTNKYDWFTASELTNMVAISESTPGPVGINMATYVGYTVAGPAGAVLATLSIVAPSIVVICIIANYFQKFKNARIVQMIFAGLKPAVVAFIGAACLNLFISTLLYTKKGISGGIAEFFNWKCIILLVVLLALKQKFPKVHPIAFIVAAAAAGVVFSF